jgi:hypothetical protein
MVNLVAELGRNKLESISFALAFLEIDMWAAALNVYPRVVGEKI